MDDLHPQTVPHTLIGRCPVTGIIVESVDKAINGCQVKTIVECEAIGKDGRIKVGDFLTSVNGETLRRVSNAQARALLRRVSYVDSDIR